MTTIESSALSKIQLADVAHTNVIDDAALANSESHTSDDYASWERAKDRLIRWWRDPGVLEDDDFVVPSRATLHAAIQIASSLQQSQESPPLRVVPDGEGGISFERRDGQVFESLNVLEDGTVELLLFRNCRLCSRTRLT